MRHIMEIPGWAYIIVGALIAIVSGVIYKDVPKDGAPNMAMAFFFFVGMIFILIGMAKFFFKKAEFGAPIILEKQESKARQAETIQHTNRVEQHISGSISRMHKILHRYIISMHIRRLSHIIRSQPQLINICTQSIIRFLKH
jgi:NAD/NADP transhydrogenase beta subunit